MSQAVVPATNTHDRHLAKHKATHRATTQEWTDKRSPALSSLLKGMNSHTKPKEERNPPLDFWAISSPLIHLPSNFCMHKSMIKSALFLGSRAVRGNLKHRHFFFFFELALEIILEEKNWRRKTGQLKPRLCQESKYMQRWWIWTMQKTRPDHSGS